jgi:uncharacterized membrane protein YfcA
MRHAVLLASAVAGLPGGVCGSACGSALVAATSLTKTVAAGFVSARIRTVLSKRVAFSADREYSPALNSQARRETVAVALGGSGPVHFRSFDERECS